MGKVGALELPRSIRETTPRDAEALAFSWAIYSGFHRLILPSMSSVNPADNIHLKRQNLK